MQDSTDAKDTSERRLSARIRSLPLSVLYRAASEFIFLSFTRVSFHPVATARGSVTPRHYALIDATDAYNHERMRYRNPTRLLLLSLASIAFAALLYSSAIQPGPR